MSIDPDYPRGRTPHQERGDLPPLPAWNARPGREIDPALPVGTAAPNSRVPPFAGRKDKHFAPQLETVLKALGVVLVITAIVVGAFIARPGGNGSPQSTATSGAVVIASSEAQVISVSGTPPPPSVFDARNGEITVCIDAGHGGKDMGYQRAATASVPAMDESFFALAIAKDLEQRLKERGFKVILTRTDDHEVNINDVDANQDGQVEVGGSSSQESQHAGQLDEMQSRIDVCNDGRADLLISVHVDGSSDPTVRGSRIWFSQEREFAAQNQTLASLTYEELETQIRAAAYPWVGQGIFDLSQVPEDNDHANVQRLLLDDERPDLKEPSAMPGVVVEVLTLSSDADATFLASEQGLSSVSAALDQAVTRFVDSTLRTTG